MRPTPLHALTALTLVGAALCALWLASIDPSLAELLPALGATGH